MDAQSVMDSTGRHKNPTQFCLQDINHTRTGFFKGIPNIIESTKNWLDNETTGSMTFRNLKAPGCSVLSAARVLQEDLIDQLI